LLGFAAEYLKYCIFLAHAPNVRIPVRLNERKMMEAVSPPTHV
jgi:hypothetical protein